MSFVRKFKAIFEVGDFPDPSLAIRLSSATSRLLGHEHACQPLRGRGGSPSEKLDGTAAVPNPSGECQLKSLPRNPRPIR